MSKEWIHQRMNLLRKQAGFAFNQDLVISILLCLMSGRDKHLILTASPQRLPEVAHMAALITRSLFGFSTASVVCQADQRPAALIQSLFAATIEDYMDISTANAAAVTPIDHRPNRNGDVHDPVLSTTTARARSGTQSLYFHTDSPASLSSFRNMAHRSYNENEGSIRGLHPVSPIDFTMASTSSAAGRRRSPPQMRYGPSTSDGLGRRSDATPASARNKESEAFGADISIRSSGRLAQAAIIQNLNATDLAVQATLLETLTDRELAQLIVAKELKIGNARFVVPKPHFLVILVLPRECKPSLSSQLEIQVLANHASKVHIDIDITRYIRDIVVGVRAHPLVQGGLTARTSQDLIQVTRSLAAIFQRDYLTPDLVSIAASKVLGHRIRLHTASTANEKRKVSPADVVAEILRVVYVPM
ncbi:hypothetical protein BX666DRAFT_1876637 [Dichotomocladium elegans]|nr:hypothetical protein BX666DRAFT_1876637 [Dichotomocladium elegans]